MQRREFIFSILTAPVIPIASRFPLSNFSVTNGRLILTGARVGGRAACVAFDTGAAASSVSSVLASRISMRETGSIPVHTVAGRVQRAWGRTNFELTGGVIQPRRVLVMPDELQHGVEAVLGTTELGVFDLQFSSGEVRRREDAPLACRLDGDRGALPIANFRSGGVAARLLIDSGSAVSSISEEGARRLASAPDVTLLFYETSEGEQLRGLKLTRLVSGGAEFTNLLLRVRVGQPSLRTRSGEIDGLLGIDVMRQFDWRFFIHRNQISVSAGGDAAQTWIGMGVDFRSDTSDPGRVLGLARGGPAERAGLKIGDRLIALNGVGPTDNEKMASVGVRAGGTIVMEFERDSKIHVASVISSVLL